MEEEMKKNDSEEKEENQEPIQKKIKMDHPSGSFVAFLLIIWNTETLHIIIMLFKKVGLLCLKEKNWLFKKRLYMIEQAMSQLLKDLKKKVKCVNISFMDFKKFTLEKEYYSIFTSDQLTIQEIELLINAWEQCTQEQSSSSGNTKTTGMLSTTATTQDLIADAQELNKSEIIFENINEDLFQPASSGSSTGLMSKSICKKVQHNLITYTSQEERGDMIVKMDIIPFSEACRMEKSNW